MCNKKYTKKLMQTVVELAVFGGALVALGDATHFTWWGVAMLVASLSVDVACGSLPMAAKHRVHVLTAVTGITIMVAVVGMSVTRCDMLHDALLGAGPWTYFFGNFALHYYPSLRGLSLCALTRTAECGPKRVQLDATLPLAAYCVLHSPSEIYGCAMPSGPWLLVLLGVVWTAAVEAALHRWLQPC